MAVFGGAFAVFWMIFAFSSVILSYAAVAAELVGNWFTFKKMNKPGWKGIIPFYNLYVLFEELWEVKEFWRVIIYLGVYLGTFITGYVFVILGTVFGATASYDSHYVGGAVLGVILGVLGILAILGSIVFVVLAIVKEYQLYKRMAWAFGLKNAWAWGLLFLSPVMLPIIGFNKNIVYYGPMRQV